MSDSKPLLPTPLTTGIGSLPHHNIDAALHYAFSHDVPYLPQIPIRNPWEYMIPQALEGMPGLEVSSQGEAVLDFGVWTGRHRVFTDHLLEAFTTAARGEAFSAFEPSAAAMSAWQPFLWECEERRVRWAKIQMAGPLTAQWALRLKDGAAAAQHPELGTAIFRLVLARATAMVRRVASLGIQPILFLDEPALYGLSRDNPRHALGLTELRLLIQALKKENAWVGMHCCSNTDWDAVLGLGLDILSIDVRLSLEKVLESASFSPFVTSGGRLSLGIVSTTHGNEHRQVVDSATLVAELLAALQRHIAPRAELLHLLRQGLYTPACGLALHSVSEAEAVLAELSEIREKISTLA